MDYITQELNPLNKPFLGAKDFVKFFGKDICSMSRAYMLIHKIQQTKGEDGRPLFDATRCPRNNVIPLSVFIDYFKIDKATLKAIKKDA